MKKRIFSMLMAFLMFLGMIPPYGTFATESKQEVSVLWFNPTSETMETVDKAELYRGGEIYLSADISKDITGDIQWQIETNENVWVDIQNSIEADLRVSIGMVKGLLKDNAVRMRCAVRGENEYYSQPVTVTVTDTDNRPTAETFGMERETVAPDPLPAPVAAVSENNAVQATATETVAEKITEDVTETTEESAEDVTENTDTAETTEKLSEPQDENLPAETATAADNADTVAVLQEIAVEGETVTAVAVNDAETIYYTVTIEYVYAASSKFAGQRVALPYIAEVPVGETMKETVTSPSCVGYTPSVNEIKPGDLGVITGNTPFTVEYSPADVSYTVRHYQQNIDDDEYTWVDTTIATGKTESLTSDDAANTYTGFTALSHYHEEIAADSSTMIDIYYDRNYHLISFDLDGGYGVDSVYARYGADISVGTPYRAGWDFAGWDGAIPSAMPAEDRTYKATWTPQTGIGFTVAYWLEDANIDNKYNFWASTTQSANAGATVQGETYKDYTNYLSTDTVNSMDPYEKRYSNYDHADTNVVIKGDGSTIVNVYYKRNEYTLKFYYAQEAVGTTPTYYVIGGSTYRFGASATISDNNKGNEVKLLDHYMNDYKSERGEVDEIPTLNAIGNDRNYTNSYDTSTVNGTQYKYHYLSFKAKYGEDISKLWPSGVFNSVTRLKKTDANGWSGVEAFCSAWNGEHHVLYSLDSTINKGNQTIKGNYNELDYKLLWKYDTYGDPSDMTVTYLCFWENGANISWSVPELYRYNIYVPVLTGNEANQITHDNGIQYYLWATYDTCDNSTVGEQTAPAINGYEYIKDSMKYTVLHKYTGDDSTQNIIATKEDSPILFDANGNQIYREAYAVNFFYSRKQYALEFVNGDTHFTPEQVYFGADISQKAPSVTYHDDKLKDIYEFSGWYTSSDTLEASKYELTNAKMPANQLILYAGWKKITHTIEIYNSEEEVGVAGKLVKSITVPYDELVDADDRPADPISTETRTFIGWYYKDALKQEQRFDFATMKITDNMKIYAKWRSNVMKRVEISYVVVNDDNTRTQIADTETLMLRLGQTRTFDAKTGNSLYEAYRTGHFPMTASHSITITDDDVESTDPVTYTFEYKKYGSVPYQVEFYVQLETDADNDGELDLRPAYKVTGGKAEFVTVETYASWTNDQKNAFAASNTSITSGTALTEGGQYIEQHWQNDKAVVVELFEPDNLVDPTWVLPDKYLPNAQKIQKIIVPSTTDPENNIKANTIKFIYTYTEPIVDPDDPDNPVYPAKYLVQHYIQNVYNTDVYELYSFKNYEDYSGNVVTAEEITIPGYTYSYDITKTKMDEYNAATNRENTLTQNPDQMTGVVTADDRLELNFYYTVNSYPYQVMYLEQDSNRVLATTKTTDSEGEQLTGLYGSKVTEEAITIEGYDIVGTSTKTIWIQMEAGDTASVNTIVFYYKLKSAELVISKNVELDATQAAQEGISEIPAWVYNQEFVFTIYQQNGFPKSVYHYTYTDAEGNSEEKTVGAGVQTIEISLKHGEKVQFRDFPMGTYTVTETYVPGFKATVGNYIAQAHTVTLDTDGQTETLAFVNYFPFYTGDLVIKKDVTKLNESDLQATEPYLVTVHINPDNSAREVDRVITFVDQNGNAVTDANGNSSFTIPKGTENTQFEVQVLVPVDGEVKLKDVPVGTFTVTEEVKGTIGYIYDFYTVKYNKAVHENDEVTGTNHTVSGYVHGGHPTAVTFHNTYKKGDLTIIKNVTQEYVNDNWTSDTFTFTITGTTELPDGSYFVENAQVNVSGGVVTVKDKDGKDPSVTITRTESGTIWTESLAFENLPAGYYTVTETAGLGNDKYSSSVACNHDTGLVNDTENPTVFTFSNIYNRTKGNLQVGKKIVIVAEGSVIDTTQEFTFVVEPEDGTLTGPYNCTVKTTNGTDDTADDTIVSGSVTNLSVVDGKLTFKLKHNEYIVIDGLPVGNYLVMEKSVEGYDSSFTDVIHSPGDYSVDPATITTGKTTVLNCQNAYPVYYSNLIVKKNVETPDDYSDIDKAPEDDVFTFTVIISDYSDKINLDGGVGAIFYDSETDTIPEEKLLSVTDDVITFELKAGEVMDINIPACEYTIAETALESEVNTDVLGDHYTTTYTVGNTVGVEGESYVISSGEKQTVTFTNTYKRHYADLKIVQNDETDNTQVFVYEVKKKTSDDSIDDVITVTVTGKGSTTITDLPYGEYTVTQLNNWSWRYDDAAKKIAHKDVDDLSDDAYKDGTTTIVVFDTDRKEERWLSGNSEIKTNQYP